MTTIFKTMSYLLALILLLHCDYYDPIDLDPIPNIDILDTEINIPDKTFLKALIERGVDSNGDGIISMTEAERRTSLNLIDENIFDLTGIGAFKNLVTLKCDRNPLKVMNFSDNTSLENLSLQGCKLGVPIFWTDLSLKSLKCDGCELVELWLPATWKLTELSCSKNKLTYLDLSYNPKLEYVALNDMPSLSMVCVREVHFPTAEMVVTTNSPNVYFTSDCDF